MEENKKEYYTVDEAAALVGYSHAYIVALINQGKVKAVKDPAQGGGGFKYQIPASEFNRLLEAKQGAIEAAKSQYANVYISMTELAKLLKKSINTLNRDAKAGNLVTSRVVSAGRKGYRTGVSYENAKKYMRWLTKNEPKFITAEEMEELLK